MNLRDGAAQLGLALNEAQLAAFERYRAELIAWNQRFNLTSLTDPADIDARHFLDSLSCLAALPAMKRAGPDDPAAVLQNWLAGPVSAVDVGAGAGFPGLPLKIVWPGLRLTLLEATGKKCRFLECMVAELRLAGVEVVQARAEDYGQGAGRAAFDLTLARALAPLPVLLEYTLPLLKPGGWLIAQKGREPVEEVAASQAALAALGGRLHTARRVNVPGLDAERTLVLVEKVAATPKVYPRRAGIPQRQPIGGGEQREN